MPSHTGRSAQPEKVPLHITPPLKNVFERGVHPSPPPSTRICKFKDLIRNKLVEQNDNYQQLHEFFLVSGRGEPPETIREAKGRLVEELVDGYHHRVDR